MPFRDNATHLRDVLEGIDHIESFVDGLDFDTYTKDVLRRSAIERQLQIITEAAKRLGDDADKLCPGPDWKGFCRMGDILRHGYHKVDDEIIWNTVKDELPPMREAIMKTLRPRPSADTKLSDADDLPG